MTLGMLATGGPSRERGMGAAVQNYKPQGLGFQVFFEVQEHGPYFRGFQFSTHAFSWNPHLVSLLLCGADV